MKKFFKAGQFSMQIMNLLFMLTKGQLPKAYCGNYTSAVIKIITTTLFNIIYMSLLSEKKVQSSWAITHYTGLKIVEEKDANVL